MREMEVTLIIREKTTSPSVAHNIVETMKFQLKSISGETGRKKKRKMI